MKTRSTSFTLPGIAIFDGSCLYYNLLQMLWSISYGSLMYKDQRPRSHWANAWSYHRWRGITRQLYKFHFYKLINILEQRYRIDTSTVGLGMLWAINSDNFIFKSWEGPYSTIEYGWSLIEYEELPGTYSKLIIIIPYFQINEFIMLQLCVCFETCTIILHMFLDTNSVHV